MKKIDNFIFIQFQKFYVPISYLGYFSFYLVNFALFICIRELILPILTLAIQKNYRFTVNTSFPYCKISKICL